MRNNEQGRSMIEMLGVLAIVGVLSVGGIAGYSKAMNKFKANKLIDQITMISTNVKTIFSGQRTYNGLTLGIASQVGILPAEMYTEAKSNLASTDVTHAFGGTVALEAATLNNATANDEMAYILTVKDVPTDACVAVLTTDFGSDATVAYGTAEVKDLTVANASLDTLDTKIVSPTSKKGMPFTVVSAKTACGNDATTTIYFKFK